MLADLALFHNRFAVLVVHPDQVCREFGHLGSTRRPDAPVLPRLSCVELQRALLSDETPGPAGLSDQPIYPTTSRLTCLSLGLSELKSPPARARALDLSLWRLIVRGVNKWAHLLSGLTLVLLEGLQDLFSFKFTRGPRVLHCTEYPTPYTRRHIWTCVGYSLECVVLYLCLIKQLCVCVIDVVCWLCLC